MSTDQSSASPILQSITIQLSAEAGGQPAEARQELVLSALAAALSLTAISAAPAWAVQIVPGGEPWLYRLTPLPDHPVAYHEAWGMIDALRGQPQIARAEPTFYPAAESQNGR